MQLTNLDKVLFPQSGYTKRDLVRYYTTIAPAILPYLRERPLNVHRWPDGVDGKPGFWQKQIPAHAPDWVARWDHPEAGRSQSHTYVVADHVATLAWLANQAAIDLHPWTSRLPEYRRPTYAYIDIDPGTETTWEQVLTLARLYRTALGHLGVQGFPKVTGIGAACRSGNRRAAALHLRPDARLGRRPVAGRRSGRPGAGVVGVVQGRTWRSGTPGLHAELAHQDPRGAVRGATGPRGRGVGTDHLGRAGGPGPGPQRWDMHSIIERVAERGDLFAGVLADPQELPPIS